MVYIKFFHPNSHWTWYGCEYTEGLFFGFVYGDYPEMGYFSLKELEDFMDFLGIIIERDEHFTPTRLSEIKNYYDTLSGE